jgi:hypothetical protein
MSFSKQNEPLIKTKCFQNISSTWKFNQYWKDYASCIHWFLAWKPSFKFKDQRIDNMWTLNFDCFNVINFPSHDLIVEIVQNSLFHEFMFFTCRYHWSKTCMMHIPLKIFHYIYMCIKHVLNTQHPCGKNTNLLITIFMWILNKWMKLVSLWWKVIV